MHIVLFENPSKLLSALQGSYISYESGGFPTDSAPGL